MWAVGTFGYTDGGAAERELFERRIELVYSKISSIDGDETAMECRRSFRSAVLCVVSLMIVCQISGLAWAAGIHTRKDTPSDFNALLANCTTTEKLALLGALNEKTPNSISDYNSAIRKGLVYRAYNKLTYLFRDDKNVDYHDIVKWAAEELMIEGNIDRLSTFELERKILEKASKDSGNDISSVMAGIRTLGAVGTVQTVMMQWTFPTSGMVWSLITPNVKDVTTFIMAVHIIKVEKY